MCPLHSDSQLEKGILEANVELGISKYLTGSLVVNLITETEFITHCNLLLVENDICLIKFCAQRPFL